MQQLPLPPASEQCSGCLSKKLFRYDVKRQIGIVIRFISGLDLYRVPGARFQTRLANGFRKRSDVEAESECDQDTKAEPKLFRLRDKDLRRHFDRWRDLDAGDIQNFDLVRDASVVAPVPGVDMTELQFRTRHRIPITSSGESV
ncbi:MAG: hypothetical protein RLO47_04920 [Nitratireductor sp.]